MKGRKVKMKNEKSFYEAQAEKLLKEVCGNFTCKKENFEEDLAHEAEVCLLKEDQVYAKQELKVLEILEKKLKAFLKEAKVELQELTNEANL